MTRLLFFLLFFSGIFCNAQLDREHWFAPMIDNANQPFRNQALYLSTPETTPFTVDIYNDNVIIGTVTVSKGNPAKFVLSDADRKRIITTYSGDVFRPVPMGLYLKGEKPFFATLRFSIKNHAEIVTSKGSASLGKEFRTVVAPISAINPILNFTVGILATEDNTQITVDEFSPNVVFSDFVTRSNISVTLNKGQSYIISGTGSHIGNADGFIGARIVADKPVTVTNGNFNGQYATTSINSSDILMDQSVPLQYLGPEFVLMKGNGSTASGMERAVVVATEDNTSVYINGQTTPSALLNKGEFYLTDTNAYVLQQYNHYNMHIRADKNIYVYQLLAGDNGSSMVATGGFNYIPPLSCFLPKRIDEIGRIDENPYVSNNNSSTNVPTKLNIITEQSAVLTVLQNNVPLTLTAQNGPFPVRGTSTWVTYSLPSVTGNISVLSTKAVTAGIAAGSDAVGYGGYFAGFSFKPIITKQSGQCLPDVVLTVTADFTPYEWLMKVGNTYIPAPGVNNTHTYQPQQAGIYAVKITEGSCRQLQTDDYYFYNCDTFTNLNFETCTVQEITPAFALSTQTVDTATLKIIEPPAKGTVTLNSTGKVIYTANPNATGTDKFKFSFCGTGTLPDCETVQATVTLRQIETHNATLVACSAGSTAIYNLFDAAVTPQTGVTKRFYRDAAFVQPISASEAANFSSAPGFVYVKLENDFPCFSSAVIELKIAKPPVLTPENYTAIHCDEAVDGILDGNYKVDLISVTPFILQSSTPVVTKYYDSPQKAAAGGTDFLTGIYSFTQNTSVWLRVETEYCPAAVGEVKLKTGAPFALEKDTVTVQFCNISSSSPATVDLADYASAFTASFSDVRFFGTLDDAKNNTNQIPQNQTVSAAHSFYYRFSRNDACDAIGTLNIISNVGTPSTVLPAAVTICDNSTTVLDAGTGYTALLWSTGETTQTITVAPGNYWVDLTNSVGCTLRQTVTVHASPKPVLNLTQLQQQTCDSDFDGTSDPLNLDVLKAQIINNYAANSALFTVRYYLQAADRDAGNQNTVSNPTAWTFTQPTNLYFRVDTPFCAATTGTLQFNFKEKVILKTLSSSAEVCDTDLNGSAEIDLSAYVSLFTTGSANSVKFFDTLAKARVNSGGTEMSAIQSIAANKTFYYRFSQAGFCDEIAELHLIFKQPKKSSVLTDQSICPETTTILDAGPGFDSYLWSTGATTQAISEVTAGQYWVDLQSNGCVYRQTVTVSAIILPEITSVDISGSTLTVHVSGGTPPYRYAMDNGIYQESNIFTNVSGGKHQISVMGAEGCAATTLIIDVIQLFNTLTPNGDGINDVLDYSALLQKEDPEFEIFDRFGKMVFRGDAANRFVWTGKSGAQALPTGSYWFVLKWKEPTSATLTQHTGWILLKNRD